MAAEVTHRVLTVNRGTSKASGRLLLFAPAYVLFPPGTRADPPPYKSKGVDYQPIAVQAFLGRAISMPARTASIDRIPAQVSLLVSNLLGLNVSPVLWSLGFGAPVAALVLLLFGVSQTNLLVAAAAFLGSLIPHTWPHLGIWPHGDQIRDRFRKQDGSDQVLTFPHSVWPHDVWHRYGGDALAADLTIYGRELSEPDGRSVLQYWAYYLYNDWANRHESDWECITLFFKPDSALPEFVVYSVHERGAWRRWAQSSRLDEHGQVSDTGTHPVAYVAVGSHAQYFEPTVGGFQTYVTRRGLTGIEAQLLSSPSDRRHRDHVVGVTPARLAPTHSYALIGLPEEGAGTDSDEWWWLSWKGRWGREDGPLGPRWQGLKWEAPWAWLERAVDQARETITGPST